MGWPSHDHAVGAHRAPHAVSPRLEEVTDALPFGERSAGFGADLRGGRGPLGGREAAGGRAVPGNVERTDDLDGGAEPCTR